MRVLVYKRTHNGDPDANGCFGVYDCMGSVRNWDFDAVVGVGGIGPEAQYNEIAGKVNWLGIGPHKVIVRRKRGPVVTFDHFLDYGTDGPDLRIVAPVLAEHIYANNVRAIVSGLGPEELTEVIGILAAAKNAPPSLDRNTQARGAKGTGRCKAKCRP